MGLTITANNSKYSFSLGYGGFFNLRNNIAMALDKDFGNSYATLFRCCTENDYQECLQKLNQIIANNSLDKYSDILDFLFESDAGGKINYRTCGRILALIKDIDFTGKNFQYVMYSKGNDYELFKEFLKECYSHRRNMVWY